MAHNRGQAGSRLAAPVRAEATGQKHGGAALARVQRKGQRGGAGTDQPEDVRRSHVAAAVLTHVQAAQGPAEQ